MEYSMKKRWNRTKVSYDIQLIVVVITFSLLFQQSSKVFPPASVMTGNRKANSEAFPHQQRGFSVSRYLKFTLVWVGSV